MSELTITEVSTRPFGRNPLKVEAPHLRRLREDVRLAATKIALTHPAAGSPMALRMRGLDRLYVELTVLGLQGRELSEEGERQVREILDAATRP